MYNIQNRKMEGALIMARTKYPDIGLSAVKKFCRHCIKTNGGSGSRNRPEYAGLAYENGSYYLVDGYRLVRFRYDLPELVHAAKSEAGGQPSMLSFIEDANRRCEQVGKAGDIELPPIEEVKAAAAMNKAAKKRGEAELPIPLAGGRIWVNPSYLLDMMEIFPFQRVVTMSGNAHQPILFGCDSADGILMPMRCDNPTQTMEQWEERKVRAQEESADGPIQRKPKRDNYGQPTSLAQLKKRLTVGAAFEIVRPGMETEQRRVIAAQSSGICSVVPFDVDNRVNKCGGSWLNWSKSAYWRFENGLCSIYHAQDPAAQAESNLILSIRVLDTTPEEDERYNIWLADLEAQRAAEQERQEAERAVAEQAKKDAEKQEIDAALSAAESAIFERGKRINNEYVRGKVLVLRLAEKYNITVPMRTAGWIAEHLASFVPHTDANGNSITPSVWSGYKGKKVPSGVLEVLFAIVLAVDGHFSSLAELQDNNDTMTGEEFERFINGDTSFVEGDSADTSTGAAGADSSHVDGHGDKDATPAGDRAGMPASDADGAIYKKYSADNLAGGHNIPLADTS